ncbi:hypothetical protein [Streptomyces sp. NPDC058955]|uniref:hypothetical protein n=1 Tax=unclassified Streptomyces TaxID=2593676 RepID=UPI00365C7AB4
MILTSGRRPRPAGTPPAPRGRPRPPDTPRRPPAPRVLIGTVLADPERQSGHDDDACAPALRVD